MPKACTPTTAVIVIVATAAALGAMVASAGVYIFDRISGRA